MKLLLIGDDPESCRNLIRRLEAAGHTVDLISDRNGGLLLPANDAYDAVMMERGLQRLGRSGVFDRIAHASIPVVLFDPAMLGADRDGDVVQRGNIAGRVSSEMRGTLAGFAHL